VCVHAHVWSPARRQRSNRLSARRLPPHRSQPLRSNNLEEIVPTWDARFVDIEQELLFELILAANYMDIKSLLDLTCAKVASMIKGACVPTPAGHSDWRRATQLMHVTITTRLVIFLARSAREETTSA
jgi:hypothetical protein